MCLHLEATLLFKVVLDTNGLYVCFQLMAVVLETMMRFLVDNKRLALYLLTVGLACRSLRFGLHLFAFDISLVSNNKL